MTVISTAVASPSLFAIALHVTVRSSCAGGTLPSGCERNTCETLERLSDYSRLALTSVHGCHTEEAISLASCDVKPFHDFGRSLASL